MAVTTIFTIRMTIFSTGTSLITSLIIGADVGAGVYVGSAREVCGTKEVLANSNLATTVASISTLEESSSMQAGVINVDRTRKLRVRILSLKLPIVF